MARAIGLTVLCLFFPLCVCATLRDADNYPALRVQQRLKLKRGVSALLLSDASKQDEVVAHLQRGSEYELMDFIFAPAASPTRRMQDQPTDPDIHEITVSYTISCGISCAGVNDQLTTLSDPSSPAGVAHANKLISAINTAAATMSSVTGDAVLDTPETIAAAMAQPEMLFLPIGCDGVPNSGLTFDQCNVCNDGVTNVNSCFDCAGVPNGIAYLDNCAICDHYGYNDCVQDCYGIWGGPNTAICSDCAGTVNGGAYEDQCGTCDPFPWNDCPIDCNGVYNEGCMENPPSADCAVMDECWECDADPNNDCTDMSTVASEVSTEVSQDFAESLGTFAPPEDCVPSSLEDCEPALSAEDMAQTPSGAALLQQMAQALATQMGVDVSQIDISSISMSAGGLPSSLGTECESTSDCAQGVPSFCAQTCFSGAGECELDSEGESNWPSCQPCLGTACEIENFGVGESDSESCSAYCHGHSENSSGRRLQGERAGIPITGLCSRGKSIYRNALVGVVRQHICDLVVYV